MVSLQELLQQSQQLQGALNQDGVTDLQRNLEQVATRSLKLVERNVREQSLRGPLTASVESSAYDFKPCFIYRLCQLKWHRQDRIEQNQSLPECKLTYLLFMFQYDVANLF
jgi:hypothetical protein